MSPLCEIRGRGCVIRLQWETEILWITLTVFDWTSHVQPTYPALLHGNFLLQHLNVELKEGEKKKSLFVAERLGFSQLWVRKSWIQTISQKEINYNLRRLQFITASELKCAGESFSHSILTLSASKQINNLRKQKKKNKNKKTLTKLKVALLGGVLLPSAPTTPPQAGFRQWGKGLPTPTRDACWCGASCKPSNPRDYELWITDHSSQSESLCIPDLNRVFLRRLSIYITHRLYAHNHEIIQLTPDWWVWAGQQRNRLRETCREFYADLQCGIRKWGREQQQEPHCPLKDAVWKMDPSSVQPSQPLSASEPPNTWVMWSLPLEPRGSRLPPPPPTPASSLRPSGAETTAHHSAAPT